jgi:ribosome-binding factor A
MSHRRERVGDAIREELARILRIRLKDPRLGFVTITEVRMSGDLKTARVYVSVLGNDETRSESLDALNAAKGFLRREVSRALGLRYAPDMQFNSDRSMEQGSRIDELLEGLSQPPDATDESEE